MSTFDNLKNQAMNALNDEGTSDQILDKAAELAQAQGINPDQVTQVRNALDERIGDGSGEQATP